MKTELPEPFSQGWKRHLERNRVYWASLGIWQSSGRIYIWTDPENTKVEIIQSYTTEKKQIVKN